MVNVNHFEKECECIYKDERYSVRDNGAVFRYTLSGKRPRPTDNQWTFGKLNIKTGYLEIASVRIHRIVATAFHGEPPTNEHVVDHIDTNKQNNRPENLRWVTRLENVVNNPITRKKIESICGCSIQEFLDEPAKFREKFQEANFKWMRTVTAEEAKACLENWQAWTKSDKPLQGGSLGEWIFSREIVQTPPATRPNYIMSKTPNAAQRIVFTPEDKPNEYPSTPQAFQGDPLTAYYESLKEGATFFRNHNGEYVVVKRRFSKDRHSLYVMTRSDYVWQKREDGEYIPVPIAELSEKISCEGLPHSLTEITYEDGLFVHEKMESGFHPTEELEELFDQVDTYNEQKIIEIFNKVEERTGINREALCFNKAKRNEYYEARKYAAKQLRLELNLSDYEIGKLIGVAESTVNLYLDVSADWYSKDYGEVSEKHYNILSEQSQIIPQNVIQKNWGAQSEFPCCPKEVRNNPLAEYAAQMEENAIFFQNIYYSTIVLKNAIIDNGKSLLVLYKIIKKEGIDEKWGIMKIIFEHDKFTHEIIPNYNNTLEHYWLKDVENHFNCIIEGSDWSPLYDSQGREFKGDYMPL